MRDGAPAVLPLLLVLYSDGVFADILHWWNLRSRKKLAIHRAVAAFRNTHAVRPIGADICHFADDVAIVRVIFSTSKRPPDRAWFEVTPLGAVREIEYEDVAVVEQPLR